MIKLMAFHTLGEGDRAARSADRVRRVGGTTERRAEPTVPSGV